MKLAFLALCVAATPVTALHADNRCVIEKVVPVPTITLPAPKCHRPPRALEQPLTRAIAKNFEPSQDGARAKVKFPCDGLGPQIDEIVLETGGGHGGSLRMFRARRNGKKFDVRGLVYQGASMLRRQPANPPFERVTGSVAIDLDRLRAATTAELTEVIPPRKDDGTFSMRGSSSSHDFHLVIRLRDSDGRVVERRYTGYESSSSQQTFLPLLVAEQVLAPITDLASAAAPIDADDRALFEERFLAAVPRFDDEYYWWVMERYVDLARFLGAPKLIPGLLTRMKVADPKNRSQVDARRDALKALATITGWDARKAAASDEAAAADYLARCR